MFSISDICVITADTWKENKIIIIYLFKIEKRKYIPHCYLEKDLFTLIKRA